MNTAPKLSISVRIATAAIALAATFATAHSLDALSTHYVQQGAAQLAANAHTGTQHA